MTLGSGGWTGPGRWIEIQGRVMVGSTRGVSRVLFGVRKLLLAPAYVSSYQSLRQGFSTGAFSKGETWVRKFTRKLLTSETG